MSKIDQLAMANSFHWHGHVLTREDGHVLKKALHFETEGQRKKGRRVGTWKKRVMEKGIMVGLSREGAVC